MEVTITINGQAVSVEVTVDVYECLDEGRRKAENLHHEKRRHWDLREFDEHINLTEGHGIYYQTPEQIYCRKETMKELLAVLDSCTATQRERFLLYVDGLSYAEIGRRCGCSKVSAYESIRSVRQKFRNYFVDHPND